VPISTAGQDLWQRAGGREGPLIAWRNALARKQRIEGNPDPKRVSTSCAERHKLTMRMQMRRFTRVTNAFSKKFENHMHMVALYTVWYNYVKQHKSLEGLSPAMAAGLSDTLWSMADVAEMVDTSLPKPGKRGPYKKMAEENTNWDTTRPCPGGVNWLGLC